MSNEYNFEIEEQDGGGFNFSAVDKKSNSLDEYKANDKLTKTVIPTYQIAYLEESSFGAYECEDESGGELKITGTFLVPLTIGQSYEVNGKVSAYKGEKQIKVETARNIKPVNERGMKLYIATLRGLEFSADMIFEIFGMETIDVIIANPMNIAREVKGIGKKSVLSWADEVKKLQEDQNTLVKLLNYGLTLKQAKNLYDVYKEGVTYMIEKNPYFLSSEVRGFGFEKCDSIAMKLGYDPYGLYRTQEGIMQTLKDSAYEGHCYLPTSQIINRAKAILDIYLGIREMKKLLDDCTGKQTITYKISDFEYPISYADLKKCYNAYYTEQNTYKRERLRYKVVDIEPDEIITQLGNLAQPNKIIFEDDKIFIPDIYRAEAKVAEKVINISASASAVFKESESVVREHLSKKGYELETKQFEAVCEFTHTDGGFYILNGSAGCGKTFTLNIILTVLEILYEKIGRRCVVRVFAPTGKAAKVAAKATGRDCMTVHRGLKYNPNAGFEFNEGNPLDADVVVVDESSMLDIQLAKHLLCAISEGTKVIFLGDTKQLPSVGPGNILYDIIESGVIKVITLDVVKRQGKQSGIIRNANKIINNEMISSCKDTGDAFVIRKEDPLGCQASINKSIDEIMQGMEFPLEEIQILCPQRTSLIGTDVMNYVVQQNFNPGNEENKVLNKRVKLQTPDGGEDIVNLYFKKGDKVIHTKNNYSMSWFIKDDQWGYQEIFDVVGITNGECGVIEEIVKEEYINSIKTKIIVRYEDKFAIYEDTFDELEHAFALTIHKSQGSQWRAVVIPIMRQNWGMLDNNLFYTGYTRAQDFCVVIGQEEAIKHAIATRKITQRFTNLQDKLESYKTGE